MMRERSHGLRLQIDTKFFSTMFFPHVLLGPWGGGSCDFPLQVFPQISAVSWLCGRAGGRIPLGSLSHLLDYFSV